MDEQHRQPDLRGMIHEVIRELARAEETKTEPAYKAELLDERKRREQLESRVNELVEENRRSRSLADELDRSANIRSELQRLGVAKVDLAYRAVKDDVRRADDGRLVAATEKGELALREYLSQFVNENPELLPPRMVGGSGAGPAVKQQASPQIDIDKIKPGMSRDDLDRVRQEIARVADQTLRGL